MYRNIAEEMWVVICIRRSIYIIFHLQIGTDVRIIIFKGADEYVKQNS